MVEPFDRFMQLNWRHFCDTCQLIPLKLWPNTALGCNHQLVCMPQLQLSCSAALVPNELYPEGMKARASPVQWSKPHSISAPTQDSNPDGRIQNRMRWPLHYHWTPLDLKLLTRWLEYFTRVYVRQYEELELLNSHGKYLQLLKSVILYNTA